MSEQLRRLVCLLLGHDEQPRQYRSGDLMVTNYVCRRCGRFLTSKWEPYEEKQK